MHGLCSHLVVGAAMADFQHHTASEWQPTSTTQDPVHALLPREASFWQNCERGHHDPRIPKRSRRCSRYHHMGLPASRESP